MMTSFNAADIGFLIKAVEVMRKIFGDIEMSFNNFRIINLETKEGREALHFYQLRFQFTLAVFTNTKIKSNKMGMVVFIRHIFPFRDRPVC